MAFLGLGLEAQVLGDQVLGLDLGIEAHVLRIGFDLGVSVMSVAVRLTLDCSTPEHHWKR